MLIWRAAAPLAAPAELRQRCQKRLASLEREAAPPAATAGANGPEASPPAVSTQLEPSAAAPQLQQQQEPAGGGSPAAATLAGPEQAQAGEGEQQQAARPVPRELRGLAAFAWDK